MATENKKLLWTVPLWALMVFMFTLKGAAADPLSIQTRSELITLDVEMAVEARERSRGLMHRKSLPSGGGMLFDFGKEVPVSMWMKNTLIPLDMMFADKAGVIRHIHKGAKPHDETIISSPSPMRWVLEVNAGFVDQFKIEAGDHFVFAPE